MTRPTCPMSCRPWPAEMDPPLEEEEFELVWGFSCQVVVFGLLPVLCSERESRSSSRRLRSGSRSARKGSREGPAFHLCTSTTRVAAASPSCAPSSSRPAVLPMIMWSKSGQPPRLRPGCSPRSRKNGTLCQRHSEKRHRTSHSSQVASPRKYRSRGGAGGRATFRGYDLLAGQPVR